MCFYQQYYYRRHRTRIPKHQDNALVIALRAVQRAEAQHAPNVREKRGAKLLPRYR